MTVFGPALHDLTREDIEEFLDQAGSEPLLWEAKGTELQRLESTLTNRLPLAA